MSPITIPRHLVNQILSHALASPEAEICGFLSEKNHRPVQCYPIPNTANNPAIAYQMDAKSLIDALRIMRERGETLFAIYHSHPHSEAQPSAIDIHEANYPHALTLIVSLNTKGILEMRGFRLRNGEKEDIQLDME